eukprot:CAMPEP_0182864874 /NCGR_PEP_ID=MMETSP0034_2-20130328/7395_1 /TAXON_ID=156128 /ORGANISM="Nephroselmis pyriformis, Strain CCMP717" /LENGTH=177 /DNA_ID=CAMNT_0024997147 /DNA_START=129 /DNA_END=659 /DNA_ORIENTATION=+
MSTMGMSRNRTQAFVKYRDAARAHTRPLGAGMGDGDASREASSSRLLAGAVSSAIGASLPPGWVDVTQAVGMDIASIKSKVVELAKCHARALLTTFDDVGKEETQVEVLTLEVTRLFRRAEQKLKALSEWRDRAATPEDAKMVTNAQRSLAGELQALSIDFRKQQKMFLQKIQKQRE